MTHPPPAIVPPPRKIEPLCEEERHALTRLVRAKRGVAGAAKHLGVSRAIFVAAMAGVPQHDASIAMLRVAIQDRAPLVCPSNTNEGGDAA